MTKYRIIFNGHIYEMEVERLDEQPSETIPMNNVQVVPPVDQSVKKQAGQGSITSVMPGLVVKILCKIGDVVKTGQTLMILEAMKMENEIVSNKDGVVKRILISEGDTIRSGEPLFEIE